MSIVQSSFFSYELTKYRKFFIDYETMMIQPRKGRRCCEDTVKQIAVKHTSCGSKDRLCSWVPKWRLKGFVSSMGKLENDKTYRVCHNLMKRINDINPLPPTPPRRSKRFSSSPLVTPLFCTPTKRKKDLPSLSVRSPPCAPLEARIVCCECASPLDLLDRINVSNTEKNTKETNVQEGINILNETIKKNRVGHLNKMRNDVLSHAKRWKYPFDRCKDRSRVDRINEVSNIILGCCIDKKEMADKGVNYIRHNVELATSLLTLLDGVKERLERELKLNFENHVGENIIDDVENKENNDKYDKTMINMFLHSSRSNFDSDRKRLIEDGKYEDIDLPSWYELKKSRPPYKSLNCFSSQNIIDNNVLELNSLFDSNLDLNNVVETSNNDKIYVDDIFAEEQM